MLLEGFGFRRSGRRCGGGGTTAGEADLASKRESRFETDAVAGAAGVLAGSRMEACASDARGESRAQIRAQRVSRVRDSPKIAVRRTPAQQAQPGREAEARSRWTIQRSFRIEGRRRNRRNRDEQAKAA